MKKEDEHFLLNLEIEKANLEREKAMVLMDKSLFLYFTAIFIGVVGFVNKFINITVLNTLIIIGMLVLLVGIMPYIRFVKREEEQIKKSIKKLK